MFERINHKYYSVVSSEDWKKAIQFFSDADQIFLAGNGGSLSTASHAAVDIMRITQKIAYSPDSPVLLTAVSNDNGYNNCISNWLSFLATKNSKSLFIGFSGSGHSANIRNAILYASTIKIPSIFITSNRVIRETLDGSLHIHLDVASYHQFEILSLMLMYRLIEDSGFICPEISQA
jgi:phosphoheptose isomerase